MKKKLNSQLYSKNAITVIGFILIIVSVQLGPARSSAPAR